MIYFDNAATTYPKPEEVYKALDYANRHLAFNSGRGGYKNAREVSDIIKGTRSMIVNEADMEGATAIFTSSATQSLNEIIFGLKWNENDIVYISPFEHNSIIRPLEVIKQRYNIEIQYIPFNKDSWKLEKEIDDIFCMKKPKYVFMSSKSNVVGYNLPYSKVFEKAKKYNAITVLDASQSFGVRKLQSSNVDFIVFAGHKTLYATFGIAGFIKRDNVSLSSTFFGGTGSDTLNPNMAESGVSKYEAGSPNIVGIYALKTSLEWLKNNNVEEKEIELSNYLIDKLKQLSKVILYLPEEETLCDSIISINIKGYLPDEVGKILDEEFDICVRTGYHCTPHIHDFIGSKELLGTVRISLSYFNTKEQIDRLYEALKTF